MENKPVPIKLTPIFSLNNLPLTTYLKKIVIKIKNAQCLMITYDYMHKKLHAVLRST